MGTLKIKHALPLAAPIVVLLVGWYLWGPAGGKLTALNNRNLAQFIQQFDGAANDQRLVLLLSPT
jgi:hypothetical protein